MANSRKTSKERRALLAEKNRIRGIIDKARTQTYGPDHANSTSTFQQELAAALLRSRETLRGRTALGFIAWVDHQTRSQIPQLLSAPVDSDLNAAALERRPKPFLEELRWVATILSKHTAHLSEFRQAAVQLELAALQLDWETANGVLDNIQKSYGKSIWWVEARIALSQAEGGLDRQKAAAAKIRKQHRNGLAAYLAAFFSIRNEPATTVNTFSNDTSERISRLKVSAPLKSYLRFKLLWNHAFSPREFSNILLIAQGLSIVDLYEAFIEVLQLAVAAGTVPALKQGTPELLDAVDAIDDYRISKLSLLVGRPIHTTVPERSIQSSDSIYRGHTYRGLRLALRELEAEPRAARTAILAAMCLNGASSADRPGTTQWDVVIRRIAGLLRFTDDYSAQWADLEKLLRNWSFSGSMRACFYTLQALSIQSPEIARQNRFLAALHSAFLEPDEIEFYPASAFMRPENRTSTTTLLHAAMREGNFLPPSLSPRFHVFFSSHVASIYANADDLAELDHQAQALASRSLAVFVRRALIAALVSVVDLPRILRVTTGAYFDLKVPLALIPLEGQFSQLRWRQMRSQCRELSLPIVLHICWRVTGNDLVVSNLRYAYSDFLTSNGLQSPSQMTTTEEWPASQVIYFLRYVCVPQIIDMSPQITSSRQTSETRRDICTRLIQLDPGSSFEYENETFAITRSLSVQDGLRVLDSSRVHVDTAAITSMAMRELESNFLRYKSLVAAGVPYSDSIEDVIRELNRRTSTASRFLEIPESDADLVLFDLIISLRQKFLLDPNHGLDSYLSKRVRHHSMSGYLRGAVENEHLITTMDHITHRYIENTYWPPRLVGISAQETQQLQNALARFSEEFDRVIEILRVDTLRVNSADHPKGLFAIKISAPIYHLIRSVIGADGGMEIFCNACYAVFWTSLNPALIAAQTALRVDAYNSISSAFHRLKVALRKTFREPSRYAAISSAIQSAADELNRNVHSVADWFNKTESTLSHQSYSIEQAVEICIEAAMHSYKPFAPKISKEIEAGGMISSVGLVQLADIVLTLFGNVRQHADCDGIVNVTLGVSLSAGLMIVRMESDIGGAAIGEEARMRVSSIRRRIADGSYIEMIRSEGQSGLFKLAGMALSSVEGGIEFDFIGDTRFFVRVCCPLSQVLVIAGGSQSANA